MRADASQELGTQLLGLLVGREAARRCTLVAMQVGQHDTVARMLSKRRGNSVPLGDDHRGRRHAMKRDDCRPTFAEDLRVDRPERIGIDGDSPSNAVAFYVGEQEESTAAQPTSR